MWRRLASYSGFQELKTTKILADKIRMDFHMNSYIAKVVTIGVLR